MGGLAERQVADAALALVRRDTDLAAEVVQRDAAIDALEREVEAFCIRLLALRQPVGRTCGSSSPPQDLPRAGAHRRLRPQRRQAQHRARGAARLRQPQRLPAHGPDGASQPEGRHRRPGERRRRQGDEVWANDEPVDEIYNGIFREMLTFMMEDPRNITAATHLLFVAKNLERIGDHATNIAETVHYAVRGESLPDDRPKADMSASAVVRPLG
jgi:phosphate transport system protein